MGAIPWGEGFSAGGQDSTVDRGTRGHSHTTTLRRAGTVEGPLANSSGECARMRSMSLKTARRWVRMAARAGATSPATRIVPAVSEADRVAAATALGVRDELPVTAEPYRQWVLQDSFAAPRPPWERDGALFVRDVTPYQLTKLRLLNGLIQTFLVGYIATNLSVGRSIPTDAIVYGSLLGFATVPAAGMLGDRFGRRPLYMALSLLTVVLAFPVRFLITSGSTPALMLGMVLGLNVGVLGLFSLESVTMAELFGSRTRFTQLALAKEIGGILTTAVGPVLAASLTAVIGSWWPIAVMLVVYSLVTFVSAYLAPETRGRDLVRLEDAV